MLGTFEREKRTRGISEFSYKNQSGAIAELNAG